MNWIGVVCAFFAGGFLGALAMALCAAGKDRPQIDPDTVAAWLLRMDSKGKEIVMRHLVRRVYHDEVHLHHNPAKRKQVGDKFTDYPKEVSNG